VTTNKVLLLLATVPRAAPGKDKNWVWSSTSGHASLPHPHEKY